MTPRGRRPKPPHLHLINGTHRPDRHGDEAIAKAAVTQAAAAFGKLERPKGLSAAVRKIWDRYIAPAGWLDGSREPAAIAFCELFAEFQASPARFPASRHSQMRGFAADLGLTDMRNRPKPDAPADEFFDD